MVAKSKKFMIVVNFGHFWSFGVPVGSPRGPSSLILEVHLILLLQNDTHSGLLAQSV